MAEHVQCPFCNHSFDAQASQTYEDGKVKVTRETPAQPPHPANRPNPALHVVDLRCPNCRRTFEYDLTNHEVFNG